MAETVVRVEGGEEIIKVMQDLMLITSPVMLSIFAGRSLAEYFEHTTMQRFAQQGTSDGHWDPLRPATQRIRESMGLDPDFPINVRMGDMRQWLSDDRGIIEPTPFGVDFWWPGIAPDSTLEDELVTAQKGRIDPPTVRRPVLELTEEDAIAIFEMFTFWIESSFRGRGVTTFGLLG